MITLPAWVTPRRRDLGAVLLVLVALLIPVPGLFRYQGPPMEEGFMLAFPQRILAGDVANVDFLHLYGPGSLFFLAGVYRVFGDHLWVERSVGLLQHLGLVFGMFALLRPWGRKVAVIGAWLSLLVVLVPVGLTAMAWNGAVALGLWALVAALAARRCQDPVGQQRRLVVAGVLAGLALSYRPDIVLAVGAAALVATWGLPRAVRLRALAGFALGLVPFLVQMVMAGPGPMFEGMFLEPVFDLRGGRSLPVPPSWAAPDGYLQKAAALRTIGWPLPALDPAKQIFLWFVLVPLGALLTLAVGVVAVRRDRSAWRPRVLLTLGAFSVGLLPQALQRPDTAHLAWVSCVALAAVPATLAELAGDRFRGWRPGRRWVPGAVFLVVLVSAIIPYFSLRSWSDLASQSLGRNRFGVEIHRDGRTFYYGDRPPAVAAQELVDVLAAESEPGQRLFVGPTDLRLTPYSDAFFYYLFPELTPATRYIEMDPGIANGDHSGLADEVRSADWLILSSIWNGWTEANDSDVPGSDEPNEVVRRDFCLVGSFDGVPDQEDPPRFELYRRCADGS